MKILLTNHFPLEGSGSAIYTQNVALELTELGHDVTCITPANELATAACSRSVSAPWKSRFRSAFSRKKEAAALRSAAALF